MCYGYLHFSSISVNNCSSHFNVSTSQEADSLDYFNIHSLTKSKVSYNTFANVCLDILYVYIHRYDI